MELRFFLLAVIVHLARAQFDAASCGTDKGCFLPKDEICYLGCNGMGSSYKVIDNAHIEFEIFANDPTGKGSYVALGFSSDENMGHESVLECSQIDDEPLSMKFSYNQGKDETADGEEPTNIRIANEPNIRKDYIKNQTANYVNGQIYCHGVVRVDGYPNNTQIFTYAPNMEYFLLMANGPTGNGTLTHHIHDATSNPTLLSQVFEIDLSTCAVDKGCFIPYQCNDMNGLEATYKVLNDSYLQVELTAKQVVGDNAYIAMAFSNDGMMANSNVIECSKLTNDKLWSMKFSYNNGQPTNERIVDANMDSYFTNFNFHHKDDVVYCSAVVKVTGSKNSNRVFKYDKKKQYHILVAGGTTNDAGLNPHDRKCASTGSTYLYNYKDEFDTSVCGKSKACFIPEDSTCTGGCAGVAVGYKILSDSLMEIEITANSKAKESWVAVGFSKDDMMGDDNVIECSALIGQEVSMKFSYNMAGNDTVTPTNTRIAGDYSSYFTNVVANFVDGILYCKGQVKIDGADDPRVFKYDKNQLYYLLLASGPTGDDGLQPHQHTGVSFARKLNDVNPKAPSQNYGPLDTGTCGTKKSCLLAGNAGVAVSYAFTAPTTMFIELVSTAASENYVAVGFNLNKGMGGANVIECSQIGSGQTSMKFSYNENSGNVRIAGEEKVESTMFTGVSATQNDGALFCTGTVDVGGSDVSPRIFKFDSSQTYYVILATGPSDSNGLLVHNVQPTSSDKRDLTQIISNNPDSGGMSDAVRHRLVVAHAILMVLAWLFFVPTAVMFARFLRISWPLKKPMGLLIWFHVHRTSNSLALLMMIGSFVCIFTANNWKWKGPGSNTGRWPETHTMVGLIALILAWLQPFVSAMRCTPNNPRRPIFNWVHRSVGVVAFTLATTAIAIAVDHFGMVKSTAWAMVLAIGPLVVLIILCVIFPIFDSRIEIDEKNGDAVRLLREVIVYIAMALLLAKAIALSVLIGIGA